MQISHQSVPTPHSFVKLFMARLDILHYPDARLHTVAKPVAAVDARIRQLIDDMAETMYDAPGVGLAAPQIGVLQRIIVIDVSAKDEKPELIWDRPDLERLFVRLEDEYGISFIASPLSAPESALQHVRRFRHLVGHPCLSAGHLC